MAFSQRSAATDSIIVIVSGSVHIRIDTSFIPPSDSTLVDSVRIRFIPGMGQLTGDVDSNSILNQKQFLWSDAKYVGDLIWKLPGFFWRDLGEAGTWGELNAFGLDSRGMGILLDGRPMNDPVTGTYNLHDMPLEFIDHTEILSGTSSMIVSSGTAMNFISRSYNSYRPMTKIRFVQDPKETILTDGLFTQNVARGLNLMIGFQRTVSAGRYTNADLDAWNVRTRLRNNISDRLNISLTDFYTKASNGLNGGIPRTQAINLADEANSGIQSVDAYDIRSRRDLTLSAIARILRDSSSMTQTSLYYSTLEREYRNPQDRFDLTNIQDFTRSAFWGVRLQQQVAIHPLHFIVGGHWEQRQCDLSRVLPSHIESEQSVFLQTEMRQFSLFIPSISFRSTSLDDDKSLSAGIGVRSEINSRITLFADASWYGRFPTIQERYWVDSTILRTSPISKERHAFIQGGVIFQPESHFQIKLTGFHRTVKDALVFQPAVTANGSSAVSISNVNEVSTLGLTGNVNFRWNHFEVVGVMTLTKSTQDDTLRTFVPDVILAGEVTYRDKFFKEKLDAKFGVRSRFYGRQQGMQFDPQTLAYIEYKSDVVGRSTTLDLFAVLMIGDAYVTLSWENIVNTPYMLAPIYPMPGRHFRLGVHWVFMD